MRKTLLLLSLWWTISSLLGATPGLTCGLTVTISGGTSFPAGAQVMLTATPTGVCQPISQVLFYNGSTLLGGVTTSPYVFTWNTGGVPTGTYTNVNAVALFAGSVGTGSSTLIDVVGDPSIGPNPAFDPSFGEGGAGTWLPGDSQLCMNTWPYNGSNTDSLEDGTCAWNDTGGPAAPPPGANSTIDNLDDTMHILSDFVTFSDTLLSKSVGTLSSTFQSWYPQAQVWIDPATGRLAPLVTDLNSWSAAIAAWLPLNYTNSTAWCVPLQSDPSMNIGGSPTVESSYIASAGTWGSLPSVVACMNYNANNSITTYQACLSALQASTCPANYAAAPPPACAAATLGRSLAGAAPAYDGCVGSYEAWVQSSLTVATDEAPKFALRSQFLTDIYTRAATMQPIFSEGAAAIQNFLTGPAAQLAAAQAVTSPVQNLPNAVIYGWQDALPSGGSGGCMSFDGIKVGCSHLVKVVAYSTARCGSTSNNTSHCSSGGIDSLLPWIQTKTSGFLNTTRSYTLTDRDGYVYVSVKRWDQNHTDPILYPNGRTLWQFLFQNPKGGGSPTGQGVIASCVGLPLPTSQPIGFGLQPQTLTGLGFYGTEGQLLPQDVTALSSAFMLNDEKDGSANVDPSAKNNTTYDDCLTQANQLLCNAPESHACAEYIASLNASGPSGTSSNDYSVRFVDCSLLPGGIPPDDMVGSGGC